MPKYTREYQRMSDYLRSGASPSEKAPAVVFGRKDPLVARALGDLVIPDLVTTAVITGGIGKDSGDILELGHDSEASYLKEQLERDAAKREYELPTIILEKNATNGARKISPQMRHCVYFR